MGFFENSIKLEQGEVTLRRREGKPFSSKNHSLRAIEASSDLSFLVMYYYKSCCWFVWVVFRYGWGFLIALGREKVSRLSDDCQDSGIWQGEKETNQKNPAVFESISRFVGFLKKLGLLASRARLVNKKPVGLFVSKDPPWMQCGQRCRLKKVCFVKGASAKTVCSIFW